MKYTSFGSAGAATATAASSGLNDIYQPAAAPMGCPTLYAFNIGPASNSADETYAVQLKRYSGTGPTFTAVTPSPNDTPGGVVPVSKTIAGVAQTVAHGTAGVILFQTGYHMRAGLAWTAIPGGEFLVNLSVSNAILLEYTFAQGSSVQKSTLLFWE
jgi:hypothetical protein